MTSLLIAFLLLSKCQREKNNDFLFDVSYNLSLVLFYLISLFESVFLYQQLEGGSKEYLQFCLFLATHSKT